MRTAAQTPTPTPTETLHAPDADQQRHWLLRATLYPRYYTWYVFVAALDILFTWVILAAGGQELNALADSIIDRWGLPGLAWFKCGSVVVVVMICETVGRRRYRLGRILAQAAVLISAFPVVVGAVHLLYIAAGVRGWETAPGG